MFVPYFLLSPSGLTPIYEICLFSKLEKLIKRNGKKGNGVFLTTSRMHLNSENAFEHACYNWGALLSCSSCTACLCIGAHANVNPYGDGMIRGGVVHSVNIS